MIFSNNKAKIFIAIYERDYEDRADCPLTGCRTVASSHNASVIRAAVVRAFGRAARRPPLRIGAFRSGGGVEVGGGGGWTVSHRHQTPIEA